MSAVRIRIRVDPDHGITGVAPPEVPPGEHEALVTLDRNSIRHPPSKPFDVNSLPSHDLGPWPPGLSLRREDLYDEDGR